MRTETGPTVHRLEDYTPTPFGIETVEQVFRLDPTETRVQTTLRFQRREGVAPDAVLELDGDGLTLDAIALDGEPLPEDRFDATPDRLTIRDVPDAFTLTCTTIVNPEANTALSGLYRSNGTYCTQCEAVGFRRIAYMYDRPDVLAVYTTRIEAPDGEPVLLGNGDPVEEGDLEGGGRYALWHDPHPKPAYLFALVAGDLGHIEDRFTTMGGREVRLRVYVEHGNEPRATWAMDSLIRSMQWDEERWGREYDLSVFNIVAVSDFNMGAMENKGLNVFNDKLVLASPETATDTDYARIEAVVAHEYFHNWTGNRITCRDWFQLCLKEGLTVYRDHEFQADMRDRDVRRIDEVRMLRAMQFPEDQGPLRHAVRPREYVEINNFYTATIYEKGSELVRMIATLLGRDAFRAGMDLYFERHDGEACTIEEFVRCFEEAGDTNLSQFMRWYAQPGTPTVTVEPADDGTLTLRQSQPPAPDGTVGEPLVIPLLYETLGENGDVRALGGGVEARSSDGAPMLVLTSGRASVALSGGATLALPVGFSAPIMVRGALEDRETRLLVASQARDPLLRWDALNAVLLDMLTDASEGGSGGTEPAIAALIGALGDDALSPAFRAEIARLPGEAEIARRWGSDVDPDAVHAARERVMARIATEHGHLLASLYSAMAINEPFAPTAEQGGRRALRNRILDLLARGEGPDRARQQFEAADNMTDRFNALVTLVHAHGKTRAAADALNQFAERYADDVLVMDKWMGVQATAPGADTLDRVIALEDHSVFDPLNPNRVRALWGTFITNPTAFHRADGRGHETFAARLATFDTTNPQLAARLANAFRDHEQLEAERRKSARNALEHLAKRSGLSTDLGDIVRRTLGDG